MQKECDFCGSIGLVEVIEIQQFSYRSGVRDILLTANIPVEKCTECGVTLMGEAGEIAQHEAVCAHLNRLNPSQIKSIRLNLKASQANFARKIGVGVASVKRWELGTVIQNESMDRIIRAAASISIEDKIIPDAPIFRTQLSPLAFRAAKLFELRA